MSFDPSLRVMPRVVLSMLLSLPAAVALAQVEPGKAELAAGIVPVMEGDKRIYTAVQFARFAPQSVADMVVQIPGFSVTTVSTDRGLGEASQNVLINGQRITGKGNDALSALRRIPVGAVRRLEIVDGATLDIPGLSGQVLNVIAEIDAMQGNFAWRPTIRERIWDHWPAGDINVSGRADLGEFTLGLRWDGFRGGGWGDEIEYRPASAATIVRHQSGHAGNDIPKLSGSFKRLGSGGSIFNVNAGLGREHFRRRSTSLYTLPGEPGTTEISSSSTLRWSAEVGTDYEFALGAGRLKLVGLFTDRHGPSVNALETRSAGALSSTGSRFSRDSKEGERVLRSEFRWRDWSSDWTASVEGARNFVDADGRLEARGSDGSYQSVPLPGASSRVEETRSQGLLSFSRLLHEGWTLQTTAGGEYSQLRQEGTEGRTRSFWRPKGSIALAWNPPSPWDFNLRVQRKVLQLNFFDFLASVDVANNNSNGANPELVPPQSWLAELETVRSLGTHGKVTLIVFGEDIEDQVAQVPISATAEAPGNLPHASRVGFSLRTGLLLDAIGIRGGKLDTFVSWRDTRLRDPLLGTHREFNGYRSYWNVDFRHDIPNTLWTWGMLAEQQSTNHTYRLNFEEHFTGAQPFAQVFLEHKNLFGLKVRATLGNLFRNDEHTHQISYVSRRDGPVAYTRDYPLEYGWIYRLSISGTF